MSKEEFLKIQTCVLKVNIHCDGCKQKVKKTLHKIDGVYKTSIDAENGKVTVYGNVNSAILIKKLNKCGKHAEFWGAPKLPNNNNHNQIIKNLNGKPVQPNISNNNNKNQNQKGPGAGSGQHIQLKGGGGGGGGGLPQPTLQQIQQLQKMKQQMPGNFPKGVKFNLPANHEMGDDFDDDEDDFDDGEDDFDDDDNDFDDEFDDLPPLNKVPGKPPMMGVSGGGKGMMPNMMNPHIMNLGKGGGGGGGGGNGNGTVHVNKGQNGGNGGNIQNHGGGGAENGGKQGGPLPGNVNMISGGGGGGGGGNFMMNGGGNGGKKGGGMNDGAPPQHAMIRPNMGHNFHSMPHHNGGGVGPNMGQGMGHMPPVAQLAHMQMSQMGSIPAVQGLPAGPVGLTGPGYFHGAPPPMMGGVAGSNPYQQHLTQMMMSQRNGNERFQPMMYGGPAPGMQYMPTYPPPCDPYTHYFSDENTSSSCSIM